MADTGSIHLASNSELSRAIQAITIPSDQDASGRTLGEEEVENLTEVIHSGTLTVTKGTFGKRLESQFAEMLGVSHATACSSGTAAIHTALAAIDPEPGDEIVTTPITDMGALAPIVYQGAIPVFADVDPCTCNITAQTIERCISYRTKAIIVTHLFGNPCEMSDILELAGSHRIPVIEDCAQAYLASYDSKYVGTMGAIGCFSLQQGKHITSGEGGLVVTNNPEYARKMYLYVNKAWGYGDPKPDHYFLALNYRISELQAAVALAQLDKLKQGVESRIVHAQNLSLELQGIPGIETPWVGNRSVHTYWRYPLMIDPSIIHGGNEELAKLLKKGGLFTAPRYIQKPAFMCEVFQKQRTFGESRFPFTLARPEALDYDVAKYPGVFRGLANILVLPWSERFTNKHVDYIATLIHDSLERL